MQKELSLLLIAVLLFLSACGTHPSEESTKLYNSPQEESSAQLTTDKEDVPTTVETATTAMTDQESYEHLNRLCGPFRAIESDTSLLYYFNIPGKKMIVRITLEDGTIAYVIQDGDSDDVAYIYVPSLSEEEASNYNEKTEERAELYDYFLNWCQSVNVTPEQTVTALDYYMSIAEPIIISGETEAPSASDMSIAEPHIISEETEAPPASEMTMGQKNSLQCAKDYLSVMPFSYTGLIEQLEYEKYSHEDAVFAADNCGADWNEQAAEKAKSYLEIMAFSKSGLIDQLVYEGFTYEQAVYGVEANGY